MAVTFASNNAHRDLFLIVELNPDVRSHEFDALTNADLNGRGSADEARSQTCFVASRFLFLVVLVLLQAPPFSQSSSRSSFFATAPSSTTRSRQVHL